MTREEMKKDDRHRFLLFWLGVTLVTLTLYTVFMMNTNKIIWGVDRQLIFWGPVFLYCVGSFSSVTAPNIGVKLFLGKPIQRVRAGPVFVPFLICQLQTFPGSVIIIEIETPREMVDEEGKLLGVAPTTEHHFKRIETGRGTIFRSVDPFRVTWSKKKDGNKDNPLDNELTTDPRVSLQLRIHDTVAVAQRFSSIEEIASTISENLLGALQVEAGQRSFSEAREQLKALKDLIKEEVKRVVGDPDTTGTTTATTWGIDIQENGVQLTDLGLPKRVNEALANLSKTVVEKSIAIKKAEGEKEAAILKGQGAGKARQAELEGEAAGLAKIAETASTPHGVMALQAATARDVWGGDKTKTVFMGNGTAGNPLVATAMEGLLGLGDKGVSKTPEAPSEPPPPTSTKRPKESPK